MENDIWKAIKHLLWIIIVLASVCVIYNAILKASCIQVDMSRQECSNWDN